MKVLFVDQEFISQRDVAWKLLNFSFGMGRYLLKSFSQGLDEITGQYPIQYFLYISKNSTNQHLEAGK